MPSRFEAPVAADQVGESAFNPVRPMTPDDTPARLARPRMHPLLAPARFLPPRLILYRMQTPGRHVALRAALAVIASRVRAARRDARLAAAAAATADGA